MLSELVGPGAIAAVIALVLALVLGRGRASKKPGELAAVVEQVEKPVQVAREALEKRAEADVAKVVEAAAKGKLASAVNARKRKPAASKGRKK